MNKTKGITIWEQHAEYFALGIATLALIGFAAMQLIGSPNAVEVPGHGTVTPGNVDERLTDVAQRLDGRLSPNAGPDLEIGDPQPVLPEFEKALAAGVAPAPTIRSLVASVPLTPGESVRVGETFTVPRVPEPTTAVARQFFDTLAEGVVDQHESLTHRFGETPYDVTWITSAAAIDLDAVVESYRDTGPDDSLAPIPTSWHGGLATILDVRVEREELVNGQWGRSTIVEPLPGQMSYRDAIREGVDATGRESIVRAARDLEAQRAIAQPAFYATRNSAFLPPDPRETVDIVETSTSANASELRQLRQWERDRENLWRQLTELGGPPPDGSPGTGGGTPPPSGGDGPGVGGGARTGSGVGGSDNNQNLTARRNLMRRITQLDRQIETRRNQLQLDQEPVKQEEDDGIFVVWAHDMDIQPGTTYRYRVVVDIYNPFHLRRMNLVEEQQDLAEMMVIASPASEWSEPIQAQAPLHPFIVSAYAAGQERGAGSNQGMGHAVAEVYRFYDGRWWQSRFTLEPGQRIGSVRDEAGTRIDFGTEWFVLDIIEDVESGGGSAGPGREGRAARVVLQHMHSGEVTQVRHPAVDHDAPDRHRLQEEISIADLG